MISRDPQSYLPLKPDVFEVLLALEAGDQHGYAILKAIEARGVALAASLLYRKLKRLMEEGLVEESRRVRRAHDDARRRYYRLTALGLDVVRAEAKRIMALARSDDVRRLAASARSQNG
jgi:DNA-binding PadR family transcriptional regulator